VVTLTKVTPAVVAEVLGLGTVVGFITGFFGDGGGERQASPGPPRRARDPDDSHHRRLSRPHSGLTPGSASARRSIR
jgi:hypothetical protein